MYLYAKNKTNKDALKLMDYKWYGISMADPDDRAKKVEMISNSIDDLFILPTIYSSIADAGSGNGAMLPAFCEKFKEVHGYEVKKEFIENSYCKELVTEFNVLNPLPFSYDYIYVNTLMYFSEEELHRFFKNNSKKFKVLIISYRFGFFIHDEARVNTLTIRSFKKIAKQYGLKFMLDKNSEIISYIFHEEFLRKKQVF